MAAVLLLGCSYLFDATATIPTASALSSIPTNAKTPPSKFVVLGGTGKIGTAVAAHLVHRISSSPQPKSLPECEIVLVGRNSNEDAFSSALGEIQNLLELSSTDKSMEMPKISYSCVPDVWEAGALDEILLGSSCVIHTAGPYADRSGPVVLDACIDFKIPVYVDVSDPIDFLEDSLLRQDKAIASGTTAILAAGAFPGMSNVLAMEATHAAKSDDATTTTVKDVRFNYFTKGLGGSGKINLYITNIGFGDPMVMHDKGRRAVFEDLSGRLLGKVDFFINDNDNTSGDSSSASWKKQNEFAKERVGTQKVFAWPFPEAATVPSELCISGSSSSAMGTAPDLWNDMLGLLVDLIPRSWWRSKKFSKFLADFSEPLVLATDVAMRKLSNQESGDCGETHAMRVDVVTETTDDSTNTITEEMVSIVQCHDSFRRCVGQSCAEFALDAWFQHLGLDEDSGKITKIRKTGVYLPEQRYSDASDRKRIVSKLTSTPGTFCYTGPVKVASRKVESLDSSDDDEQVPLDSILLKSTSTPGLICNGSPIEIRLERSDEEKDALREKAFQKYKARQELPVYPTEVREIVQAMDKPLR